MEPHDKDQLIQSLITEKKTLEKKLAIAEKARQRTEKFKNQNQEVLDQVNQKLSDTLEQLKLAQVELIHQEKMAGLGQLIAGISHEINTPAGAIVNSISELYKDYAGMFGSLIHVIKDLPADLMPSFLESAKLVTNVKTELGTREERQIAKDICKILNEHNIEDSLNFSRNLATIGFNQDNLGALIPLLKSPLSNSIYRSLFMLGMNAIHVRDIQIGIQKILSLVKALKLYSHSETEELGYTKLDQDIYTTLIILHNRLKHGVTVIKEFDPLPEIKCYADQLNQVWTNLINNAIEAMKGKGQIIIRLRKADDHQVKVEIEDNGPGISEKLKPKVFDPYFTTKPKGEGTGLGLSISKAIIEKHKGKIEVESKPGQTVFRVILPLDVSSTNN